MCSWFWGWGFGLVGWPCLRRFAPRSGRAALASPTHPPPQPFCPHRSASSGSGRPPSGRPLRVRRVVSGGCVGSVRGVDGRVVGDSQERLRRTRLREETDPSRCPAAVWFVVGGVRLGCSLRQPPEATRIVPRGQAAVTMVDGEVCIRRLTSRHDPGRASPAWRREHPNLGGSVGAALCPAPGPAGRSCSERSVWVSREILQRTLGLGLAGRSPIEPSARVIRGDISRRCSARPGSALGVLPADPRFGQFARIFPIEPSVRAVCWDVSHRAVWPSGSRGYFPLGRLSGWRAGISRIGLSARSARWGISR